MRSRTKINNNLISLLLAAVLLLSVLPGFAVSAQTDSAQGTITVSIERFAIGQGYLIEPYIMDICEGDTYEDICRRVLEENGYSYDTKGASFYLSGIHGADQGVISIPFCIAGIGPVKQGANYLDPPDDTAENEHAGSTAWLGEFSYSRMSGWMYSVGNSSGSIFPGVGMDGYTPKDGDVFRLQFTVWGYGEDLTGISRDGTKVYYEVGDKTALTRKIAWINRDKESWFTIEGCREAYENAMECLKKLDAGQAELDTALAALPGEETELPEKPPGEETKLPEKPPQEENQGSKPDPDPTAPVKSIERVMQETSDYMLSIDTDPAKGSEWFVLGLARSGKNPDDVYFDTYYNHIANYLKENNGKLTNTALYTEYSKMILVMTAIGKNAENVAGYNLLSHLSDFDKITKQGINGPIWALIAVNSREEYDFPKISGAVNLTTQEKLLDCILEAECSGGGWAMTGDMADPDITGMALQALAYYYGKQGYDGVTAAVDRAVLVLSSIQNSTGGFSTMNVETSESAAQVLTGLCAVGIDPKTDSRFIKNGHWIVENLISYHIDGSGFMHVKAGAGNNGGAQAGTVNGMATEQAYYALTAYQRFTEGETSLYDMSDIELRTGGDGDGSGTGQEMGGSAFPDSNIFGQGTSWVGSPDTAGVSSGITGWTFYGTSGSASVGKHLPSLKNLQEGNPAENEEEKGWSFTGEEYRPDKETEEYGDDEKEAGSGEKSTLAQMVFSKANGLFVLFLFLAVLLLIYFFTKRKRRRLY